MAQTKERQAEYNREVRAKRKREDPAAHRAYLDSEAARMRRWRVEHPEEAKERDRRARQSRTEEGLKNERARKLVANREYRERQRLLRAGRPRPAAVSKPAVEAQPRMPIGLRLLFSRSASGSILRRKYGSPQGLQKAWERGELAYNEIGRMDAS